MRSTTILGWSAFAVLVAVAGYLALRACVLSLPFIGPVISRCPTATYADLSGDLNAETQSLLDELGDLQFAASGVKSCPAELPSPIENLEIPEAEHVLVILDMSGSMAEPVVSPSPKYSEIYKEMLPYADEYNRLIEAARGAVPSPREKELKALLDKYDAQLAAEAGDAPRRIEEAKRAIRGVLEDPPGGKPVSLWGFGQCKVPPTKLYPSPPKSPAAVVDAIQPQLGTPLADTISYVPSMLEPGAGQSEERGINIVIFSDGLEGCSTKQPCEEARKVKETHPFVYMHVVNLAPDLEKLSCVASNTGGVQVDGNNSAELTRILRYVAQAG